MTNKLIIFIHCLLGFVYFFLKEMTFAALQYQILLPSHCVKFREQFKDRKPHSLYWTKSFDVILRITAMVSMWLIQVIWFSESFVPSVASKHEQWKSFRGENLSETDEFLSDPWIFSCWTEYICCERFQPTRRNWLQTFNSVAKFNTICIVLSIAANEKLDLFDVQTIRCTNFLNGEKNIYVNQSEGYDWNGCVCEL